MKHSAAQSLWIMCNCLDVREIGDMDEGVVEGGEDTCNSEDELACGSQCQYCLFVMFLARGLRCRPSLTCGPSEMFSVAPRSTFFFGGMLAVLVLSQDYI